MFINVVGLKLQGIPVRRRSYSSAPPQSPLVVLVMLLYMYNLEKMGRNLHVCTVHGKCNQILCQVNLRLTLNYFSLDFFRTIICLRVASIECSVASVQKEKNINWKKIVNNCFFNRFNRFWWSFCKNKSSVILTELCCLQTDAKNKVVAGVVTLPVYLNATRSHWLFTLDFDIEGEGLHKTTGSTREEWPSSPKILVKCGHWQLQCCQTYNYQMFV